MTSGRRSGPKPPGPAGEDGGWRPSAGPLAAALGIAVGGLAALWWGAPAGEAAPPPPAAASAAMAMSPAASAAPLRPVLAVQAPPLPPRPASAPAPVEEGREVRRITPNHEPGSDPTPDLSDYLNKGEKPTMAEVISRLHQAGVYTGLGAFQPPGTRPPLVGLAVPEDFVLPEGYVRHYQATDDGQRIEPILMFSPDYQFYDSQNRPIAIPKDRVVPPEMAPPGLPIRRIVVPAPVDPARDGR